MHELRERFARRLAGVDALLAQLMGPGRGARLGAGEPPGEDLVAPLFAQVEALAEMLEDGRRAAAVAAL